MTKHDRLISMRWAAYACHTALILKLAWNYLSLNSLNKRNFNSEKDISVMHLNRAISAAVYPKRAICSINSCKQGRRLLWWASPGKFSAYPLVVILFKIYVGENLILILSDPYELRTLNPTKFLCSSLTVIKINCLNILRVGQLKLFTYIIPTVRRDVVTVDDCNQKNYNPSKRKGNKNKNKNTRLPINAFQWNQTYGRVVVRMRAFPWHDFGVSDAGDDWCGRGDASMMEVTT